MAVCWPRVHGRRSSSLSFGWAAGGFSAAAAWAIPSKSNAAAIASRMTDVGRGWVISPILLWLAGNAGNRRRFHPAAQGTFSREPRPTRKRHGHDEEGVACTARLRKVATAHAGVHGLCL